MNSYIQANNPYIQEDFDFLIDAFKVEYRKENPGKPASMERVHFASWVAGKLYMLAADMDDDRFYDWKDEYIRTTAPSVYKKYQKHFED